MRLITSLVLISFLAGVSMPARAAESKKEIAARLDAVQKRVEMLEGRMPAAVQMQERLDDLESQLRSQTGTTERLEFENRKRRDELIALQRAFDILSKDVQEARTAARQANAALGRMLTGEGGPVREEQALNGNAPVSDAYALEAKTAYDEAKAFLEQGYFDQARAAFEGFITSYGDDPLAGPALFWLGEINAVQGDFRSATNAYIETLKRFPKGSKAPEAMVKLGAALFALGDQEEACRALKAFPAQYPKAAAGVRARAKIERARAGCS